MMYILVIIYREQKYLKAHKHRCKPNTTQRKKINTRWELDTTHKETIKRLKRLHDSNDDIDWAIFDFKDYKKNTKYLVIPDDQYGSGGSEELSNHLAEIDEVKIFIISLHCQNNIIINVHDI